MIIWYFLIVMTNQFLPLLHFLIVRKLIISQNQVIKK